MTMWLNKDGTINTAALDALEASLRAVTDSSAALDAVIKGAKIGAPVVVAFKCNHSGLYLPDDYVKNWGKPYGIGLGPDPVSEVLDSDYDTAPPKPDENTMDINTIMHPLRVTRVQVDLVTIPEEEYNANQAILAVDDPRMLARAKICRSKQLDNPKGRLRTLEANWMALSGMVVLQRKVG
jgi:hypothetical protein